MLGPQYTIISLVSWSVGHGPALARPRPGPARPGPAWPGPRARHTGTRRFYSHSTVLLSLDGSTLTRRFYKAPTKWGFKKKAHTRHEFFIIPIFISINSLLFLIIPYYSLPFLTKAKLARGENGLPGRRRRGLAHDTDGRRATPGFGRWCRGRSSSLSGSPPVRESGTTPRR